MSEQISTNATSGLYIQAVEKAFAVLEVFSEKRHPMTLSEISKATDLGMSAIQRYIYTMERLGYVSKNSRKEYVLSPKILGWVSTYFQSSLVYELAVNRALVLNEEIDESVHVLVRDQFEVVYVYRSHRREARFLNVFIGTREGMYYTAAGRAILAFLSNDEATSILASSALEKVTPVTNTCPEEIITAIRDARARGYAIVDEESGLGEFELAAPIFNDRNEPYAAIMVPLSKKRWTLQSVEDELAPKILACAKEISYAQNGNFPRI